MVPYAAPKPRHDKDCDGLSEKAMLCPEEDCDFRGGTHHMARYIEFAHTIGGSDEFPLRQGLLDGLNHLTIDPDPRNYKITAAEW